MYGVFSFLLFNSNKTDISELQKSWFSHHYHRRRKREGHGLPPTIMVTLIIPNGLAHLAHSKLLEDGKSGSTTKCQNKLTTFYNHLDCQAIGIKSHGSHTFPTLVWDAWFSLAPPTVRRKVEFGTTMKSKLACRFVATLDTAVEGGGVKVNRSRKVQYLLLTSRRVESGKTVAVESLLSQLVDMSIIVLSVSEPG